MVFIGELGRYTVWANLVVEKSGMVYRDDHPHVGCAMLILSKGFSLI